MAAYMIDNYSGDDRFLPQRELELRLAERCPSGPFEGGWPDMTECEVVPDLAYSTKINDTGWSGK